MRYKLTIAYDGTAYCGWQVQPSGTSIQSLLEQALRHILRLPTPLIGSGRTDAGVHARGQIAHFDPPNTISPSRLRLSLNALLPLDIRILQLDEVGLDFHARYRATSKIYHYHLHLNRVVDPFIRLYRHSVFTPCDLNRMADAAVQFLGTHDFLSFANENTRGSASLDSIRTLFRLDLVEEKGGFRIEFEGDGFLYKMVRNITGTLLDVGAKKLDPLDIPKIFRAKDRRRCSAAAPPQGLFLMEVKYPAAQSDQTIPHG